MEKPILDREEFDKRTPEEIAEDRRLAQGALLEPGDIKKIVEFCIEKNPYKVVGNYDSYSEYNMGWLLACEYMEDAMYALMANHVRSVSTHPTSPSNKASVVSHSGPGPWGTWNKNPYITGSASESRKELYVEVKDYVLDMIYVSSEGLQSVFSLPDFEANYILDALFREGVVKTDVYGTTQDFVVVNTYRPDAKTIQKAWAIVHATQIATPTNIQRRMGISYVEAEQVLLYFEGKGVISKATGAKPREVLAESFSLEKDEDGNTDFFIWWLKEEDGEVPF